MLVPTITKENDPFLSMGKDWNSAILKCMDIVASLLARIARQIVPNC